MSLSRKTIIVCGGGLAGNMTAISLANGLGPDHDLIQLRTTEAPAEDMVYGNASDPDSYNFLRNAGLDEPTLVLDSATSFSYGTCFRRWLTSRSWMQCHQAPFPLLAGIPLRHHLTRAGMSLEPLLVSAQAAQAGGFAHPLSDRESVLSQAEYGYQFDGAEWTALLERRIAESRIRRIDSPVRSIEVGGDRLTSIQLETGETVTADLFVDASGPLRQSIHAAGGRFNVERTIYVTAHKQRVDQLGPPYRTVELNTQGWTSTAHLQNAEHALHVSAAITESAGAAGLRVELGALEEAWIGNCVAIGHAASVIEPLTPAPLIMLRRDIERLLELIPVAPDMTVERREFNRRFQEDFEHIKIFQDALLMSNEAPDSPYWHQASQSSVSAKLGRKITQFENRGILAGYDLEPFSDEDWTIAHIGMGRQPKQYDRQVERVPEEESRTGLARIQQSIRQLVSRIPPHSVYMTRLKQYLEKQEHV